MANRKRKISVRLREQDLEDLRKVAKFLKMDISECVRHSLRYGLAGLLKFETAGKMTLKKLLNPEEEKPKEQEKNTPNRGKYPQLDLDDPKIQEQIKIVQTKWLSEEE